MALPKRRQSHSRTRLRRSHDALVAPNVSNCSECGEPKQPHRLCAGCGTYNGKTVVKFDDEIE